MHFLRHRSLPRGRFGAVVAAVLLAMACDRRIEAPTAAVTSEEPRRGGTAVIGSGADFGGVNELTSSHSTFSRAILEKLFLHLLEEQPDYALHPPTFAPQLAASYEWSEDHLVLTLHLRPEVVWSDGVPVTAEDVRWTWQAQIDPELAWEYAQVKESIVDMEVVDSHTLKVLFKQAAASQLTDLNEGVILPRHVWSRLPAVEWNERAEWFTENLVVNGPFTLESWSPQSEIVLERNESFYKPEQPYLDRVVFRIVPEKSNRILQLLAGDLDLVEQIPPAEAARIRDDEALDLLEFWHRQYDFICWNLDNPLFAAAATRRALTLAIDRQSIIDALLFGYARVATSPIISTVWAHDPELEPWPYDPAAARELLAGEGWRDADGNGILDRDGQPFRFELSTNTDSRIRVDAAVMIQEQLRRVGIDARVRRMEFNTLVDKNLEHDFDATLGAWGIDTSLDLTYA
ncbi:MAG: ABC transporter substrate-binding protein, partial [Thermoanaerobaculia bacterium]